MNGDSAASSDRHEQTPRMPTTAEREFLPTEADPTMRRPGVAWTTAPIRGRGLGLILAGWAALSVVTTGLGLAVVEWWEGSDLAEADADINRWWAARRAPWLDELAELGSAFSDTRTIVVVGLALIPLFLWWFGRWHEVALIVGVMVLETTVYLVPSRLVGRERPPVDQVAGPTNDHSFPSGHVAAAIVFYGALAVIVTWHATQPWAHTTWKVIAFVVPTWVAWSRVYIGAHHVTDFAGSLVIGVGVLVVVTASIRSHDAIGPPDAIVTDRADDPRDSTSTVEGASP
jgi:membrane-associated phospholipid phosphatase